MEYGLAAILGPEPDFPVPWHLLPHRVDPKHLAHVRIGKMAINAIAAFSMEDWNHMITLFQIRHPFPDTLNYPGITSYRVKQSPLECIGS